jgi:TolB-like protein/tetratricopeptide (TPR) repeat protein
VGSRFLTELRRRGVLQSAAIYGAVAWGVTEIVVTVVQQLFLPQWVSTLTVIVFVVGFPVAMFLAWTFDFTAQGIRRTEVGSRRGTASIVFSMLLLVAGTAGLFFLIRPSLQQEKSAWAAVEIPPNSVAVLPFENAGLGSDDAYLGEGLSDELRDQLGRVTGIRVAARSSSRAAVERQLGALEVSEQLRVASIVEGSIRRQGGILRISVQLIEGRSGLAAWSETFDRSTSELLMVQQAIAEAVVAHLLPESTTGVAQPATWDPTASELMMVARAYEQQVRAREDVDVELLLKTVQRYRQATEADPESALAHSRLAGALIYLGDLEAAEGSILTATIIDPNSSEVQNTLGEFYWARGQPGAGEAWARAVELNPNNPDALTNYARWRWYRIQIEGVEELYERALELDSLNLERYAALGAFLAFEKSPAEARELITRVEARFDGAAAWRVIAELHAYLGEVDRAIAWTIRARDLEPDNESHAQKLAEYFADIGDFETALRLDPGAVGILFKMRRYGEVIDSAEQLMIEIPEDFWLRTLLAISYNATGNYESAIYVLSTTGLPDSVFNGWRSTAEWDGFVALINALFAAGETDLAEELARWADDYGYTPGFDWWLNVPRACTTAILGRDDAVREHLRRAQKSPRLAWDPWLKDFPCFARFADDPVYQATIRHFDERRAQLRERLPATLAEFGVEL